VGVKLALLFLWTALLFQITSPHWLALAGLTVLALTASCGTLFLKTALRMLRPLWPFVVIVAIWHIWLRDPSGGAIVALRMLTTVVAANFVTMTTSLSAMTSVIGWIVGPLRHLGVSPKIAALSVALVIRFIPVMLVKSALITDAWRARSPRRPAWRVLVPVLLAALDDAEAVADALRARGGIS